MKAVLTVIGKDAVGIIAKVSGECARCNVNITEITQSVIGEYFAMIMLVDISNISVQFSDYAEKMAELGHDDGLEIRVMHQDIFDAMHRI